jgi:hypothetical protein
VRCLVRRCHSRSKNRLGDFGWRRRRYDHNGMPRKPIDRPHFTTDRDVLITEKQLKGHHEGERRVCNQKCKDVEPVSHDAAKDGPPALSCPLSPSLLSGTGVAPYFAGLTATA